jgi:hypothetical protein
MVIFSGLPRPFIVDTVVNMLMSSSVSPSTHWVSTMSTNQHTPKQIKVLAWADKVLVFTGCMSFVLSDLEQMRIDDRGCRYADSLADHLVAVIKVANVYGVLQDHQD